MWVSVSHICHMPVSHTLVGMGVTLGDHTTTTGISPEGLIRHSFASGILIFVGLDP